MRLGINLMAWGAGIGPAERARLPALAQMGYAGVEIPVFDPAGIDVPVLVQAVRESGLSCTVSSALPHRVSLLDPAAQAEGIAFVRRLLEVAAQLGAEVVCGPLYHPVGRLSGQPRTAEEWHSCVRALRELARVAAACGVTLAIEPLNRFETYFLNTARDARFLIEEVGSRWVGVHLDTFHMNIEEKSFSEAIRQAGDVLVHVHCSENDRGIVGSGHIPWACILSTLRAIGYRRWVVCETFAGHIPELAAATALWRTVVPDPDTYARESARFLQAQLRELATTAPTDPGGAQA
jgi:D-psicose/D-tagatose/L-ribulose 3-epimerase